MKSSVNLQSAGAIHRIIQDAARAVERARKDDPTALQEISDSTDGDPFRVLISTVLSHRTRDPMTALASSRLFARFPNVKSLAAANTRTVARLIKPVGFYNTKSRTVKMISKILLAKYGGKVPENMEQLLELPSVGRKTANCVFVYGFKTPAIPFDPLIEVVKVLCRDLDGDSQTGRAICQPQFLDIECHMTEAACVVMTDWVVTLVKSCAKRAFHSIARLIRLHSYLLMGHLIGIIQWVGPVVQENLPA